MRFHGHAAQIEFAAAEMSDPEHSCFVRLYGGGVMVNDPAVSGHTFIPVDQLKNYEDLEFVARRRETLAEDEAPGKPPLGG